MTPTTKPPRPSDARKIHVHLAQEIRADIARSQLKLDHERGLLERRIELGWAATRTRISDHAARVAYFEGRISALNKALDLIAGKCADWNEDPA